jgi:hypothetical protein
MQFGWTGHIEHTEIGVMADYPPNVTPLATALEFLETSFLVQFQLIGALSWHLMREVDGHLYEEKHVKYLVLLRAR